MHLDGLRVLGGPGFYFICRVQRAGMARAKTRNLLELGGYTRKNPSIISNNGINSESPTCHGIRDLKCPCPTRPGGS